MLSAAKQWHPSAEGASREEHQVESGQPLYTHFQITFASLFCPVLNPSNKLEYKATVRNNVSRSPCPLEPWVLCHTV